VIRKTLFWLHLSAGVTAGVFIFSMAATGVVLAFERQIVEFVDSDARSVSVPNDVQPRPMNELLEAVRHSDIGDPTAIAIRNRPQAATQFVIGRSKTVYVDPYCGAVLGVSSARAHEFFFAIERLHRSLGAPLGSKTVGYWFAAISNLLFGALILLGVVLWLPRKGVGRLCVLRLCFERDYGAEFANGIGTTSLESRAHSLCSSSLLQE
jgi:uncharacterized iron-regulated membrane protein